MQWTINMQSVTTAIAVNTGMIKLSTLVKVAGDADRIALFTLMQSQGLDSSLMNILGNTSTYFGTLADMCLSKTPFKDM